MADSYQKLSADLDDVLIQLQADDVDVDQALKLYEKGQKLAKQLEVKLSEAENKVRELKAGS